MPRPDLRLLVRKLEAGGRLSAEDGKALLALPFNYRAVPPTTYLVREGEPPRSCAFLLSGFAFRHKLTSDGHRQIVSIHVPGEAIDLQSLYLAYADHNAQTLTEAELAVVPMTDLRTLMAERPAIARVVLLDMLVEASILREWLLNVGRRSARGRLAHFLCEFAYRLNAQGQQATPYELPMTQEQIADALGLTTVHTNRSIKTLEADGLVKRNKRTVTFPDIAALQEVAGFNPSYLHLDQGPALL